MARLRVLFVWIVISIVSWCAGFLGMFHGYFEILQGNVAPRSILIEAWPEGEAGWPAMTLIPNFLITGICAFIVSLVFLVFVMLLIYKKKVGY